MGLTVKELAEKTGYRIENEEGLESEVTGVYIGDMLSWVMAKAPENSAWITICGHVNIVAVALLTGVTTIIVAEGAGVEPVTLEKAKDEDITILTTADTAYEAAKKLVNLGL